MMASVQFFGMVLTSWLGSIVNGIDSFDRTTALTGANGGMTVLCIFVVLGWLLLLYKSFGKYLLNGRSTAGSGEGAKFFALSDSDMPLSSELGDGQQTLDRFTDEEILNTMHFEHAMETD